MNWHWQYWMQVDRTMIWKLWSMHPCILMTTNTVLAILKLLKLPGHQFIGLQPWRLTRRGMVSQYTFYILPSPWMYSCSLWMFWTIPTNFRFLWHCIMSKLWSERESQQDATVRCLLSILSQHVSGIIMPIFRRTRRVLLHVVCCAVTIGRKS